MPLNNQAKPSVECLNKLFDYFFSTYVVLIFLGFNKFWNWMFFFMVFPIHLNIFRDLLFFFFFLSFQYLMYYNDCIKKIFSLYDLKFKLKHFETQASNLFVYNIFYFHLVQGLRRPIFNFCNTSSSLVILKVCIKPLTWMSVANQDLIGKLTYFIYCK